jgi:uncharacterized protein YkwD
MTLTKQKSKRPTTTHKKRTGDHHRRGHSYLKSYWPYLPMAAIITFGIVSSSALASVHRSVLGYATDMSAQVLLDDTNHERNGQNLASLTLNDKLNQAAQAKAADMATRNYWSHNTPDGQTPWTFIVTANYSYKTAGENLAYGFDTAADTTAGWMNSPEHRANLLNTTYKDVGFGIIDIANYQSGGPETLVVAMYGSSAEPSPQPLLTMTSSVPTPVVASPKPEPPADAPTPASAPPTTPAQAAPVVSPIATTTPATTSPNSPTSTDTITPEPATQHITQLQLVASNTPLTTSAITILGLAALLFIAIRHGLAWRKVFVRSEAFVLKRPLFDITAATCLTVVIVLSHTAGLIR